MNDQNPYSAPDETAPLSDDLTVGKGLKTVVVIGLAFAVVGSLLGLTLGIVTPSYYRTVFGAGDDPTFVAWQVGFGLGISQGLISGSISGAIVVLAVAWYRSRKRRNG